MTGVVEVPDRRPIILSSRIWHERTFAYGPDGTGENLTGEQGFEPQLRRPERRVLPLHHSPVHRRMALAEYMRLSERLTATPARRWLLRACSRCERPLRRPGEAPGRQRHY